MLDGDYVHHHGRGEELRRRLRAACQYHRVQPDELDGWFQWVPPRTVKLATSPDGVLAAGELETELRKLIRRHRIDLVVIDPFVKAYGGDINENSNSTIDAVCEIITRLAIELDFALDILHHDAKGPLVPGDIDRGRGASALRDAARLVRTLTPMSKEEANSFGLGEDERRLLVRYDDAKVNLAPPGEARWFRLVGVEIGNGNREYPKGDTVQTVEVWSPPAPFAGVMSATANAILDQIDAGLSDGRRYSAHHSATDRAAWRVVQQFCPDKPEGPCRAMIKRWLKYEVLETRDCHDPEQREERKGLYVNGDKRPS